MSDPKEMPHGFPNSQDFNCIGWTTIFGIPITQNTDNEGLQQPPHGGWAQVPPAVMPWGTPDGTLPHVVRFTGEKGHPFPSAIPLHPTTATVFLAQKRKCEPENIERPVKQFITEEKMAAQLKNMHISNKYVTRQSECGGMDVEAASNISKGILPTLTLSKEVQSLPTLETLLPETILTDLRKPSRALVLWKPPSGEIGERLKQIIQTSKQENDNHNDSANNNTSTPDLNSMATPEVYSMDDDKTDAMDV